MGWISKIVENLCLFKRVSWKHYQNWSTMHSFTCFLLWIWFHMLDLMQLDLMRQQQKRFDSFTGQRIWFFCSCWWYYWWSRSCCTFCVLKMFSLHFFRHLRTNSGYNLDVFVFEWPQTRKSFCQLHVNSSLTFCRGLEWSFVFFRADISVLIPGWTRCTNS